MCFNMDMTKKGMTFEQAAGQDAAEYLETQAPVWYDATVTAVNEGKTPEQIYSAVLRVVGGHREALAVRCRQLAAYLQGQGDE